MHPFTITLIVGYLVLTVIGVLRVLSPVDNLLITISRLIDGKLAHTAGYLLTVTLYAWIFGLCACLMGSAVVRRIIVLDFLARVIREQKLSKDAAIAMAAEYGFSAEDLYRAL